MSAVESSPAIVRFPGVADIEWQRNEGLSQQIPSNVNGWRHTAWKVIKVISGICTLGVFPVVYNLGKNSFNIARMAYHSVFDGRRAVPEADLHQADSVLTRLDNMQQLGNGILVDPIHGFVFDAKIEERILKDVSAQSISEQLQKNRELPIAIPVILEGGLFKRGFYSRDHITTLIIDPQNKKIIFIDPKGKTLADLKTCKTVKSFTGGLTVEDIFNRVEDGLKDAGFDLKEWTLLQNRTQYQFDGYNCGVHFLHNAYHYIEDRTLPQQLTTIQQIKDGRFEFMGRRIIALGKPETSSSPQQDQSSPAPSAKGDDF